MSRTEMKFWGKAWVLGNNISTDLLSPGHYVHDPTEIQLRHVLEAERPDFAGGVKPGDLVVAGKNFGCGSSRESAPQHLKDLGVAVVVAESFARIFARNAIAIGLPALTCSFIAGTVCDGEQIFVNVDQGEIVLASGTRLQAERLPEQMLEVLAQGGIVPMLREMGSR